MVASEPLGAEEDLAPVPDFRYVGLEPVEPAQASAAAVAFGAFASATVSLAGADTRHALLAGALSSAFAAVAMRGAAAARAPERGSARMAVVPWGVLVDRDETPRILRWAAVKRVDVVPAVKTLFARRKASRVVVETSHERFEGEARGAAPLERLVTHLEAYALEQAAPIALGLEPLATASLEEGDRPSSPLVASNVVVDPDEPFFEPLLGAAREFLRTANANAMLGLASSDYRHTSHRSATPSAVELLRRVLAARRRTAADARAFAAVLAAELGAVALRPELVALTQSPHPFVAAVAKQAARKLGVQRARTGTLDEVAPFLWEADRGRLEAWLGPA